MESVLVTPGSATFHMEQPTPRHRNTRNGAVFVPVVNAGADFYGGRRISADVSKGTGELDALDAATGQIQWKADLDAPDFGAATVVGDLVFTSTFKGKVVAFDRTSGAQVWTWQAPGGINGFLSVAGDTLLVPVGLASPPQLVALRIGAPEQATPQPSATSNPPAGYAPASSAGQLTLGTPADNPLSFDSTTLKATPGAQVTVQYTNNSTLPHNWHLFDGPDANSPSLAQTPIKSGPGDVESVQFIAPAQQGSYFYQCDVHPTMMTGRLVVN